MTLTVVLLAVCNLIPVASSFESLLDLPLHIGPVQEVAPAAQSFLDSLLLATTVTESAPNKTVRSSASGDF